MNDEIRRVGRRGCDDGIEIESAPRFLAHKKKCFENPSGFERFLEETGLLQGAHHRFHCCIGHRTVCDYGDEEDPLFPLTQADIAEVVILFHDREIQQHGQDGAAAVTRQNEVVLLSEGWFSRDPPAVSHLLQTKLEELYNDINNHRDLSWFAKP
jgi:hypothetical protein